jgi:hypothetical protein
MTIRSGVAASIAVEARDVFGNRRRGASDFFVLKYGVTKGSESGRMWMAPAPGASGAGAYTRPLLSST